MEEDHAPAAVMPSRRTPWNKGRLVGAKPPLRPSHVKQTDQIGNGPQLLRRHGAVPASHGGQHLLELGRR